MYYDREGQPLEVWEWAKLHSDPEYRVLKKTEIGPYVVSTVWLGLDHNFGDGPPAIFETMVFTASAWSEENRALDWDDPEREPLHDIDCERYCTEDEAFTGHRQMVELIQATHVPIETGTEVPNN